MNPRVSDDMASNKFDRLVVNIDELFRQFADPPHRRFPSYATRLIRRACIGGLLKLGLYRRLVDAGFVRAWFDEFEEYWIKVLKGRPILFPDFSYLLGVYRQRFQACAVEEGASAERFLDAWQNPATLYLLFGAVRTYAHQPFFGYRQERWVSDNDRLLEFGCGIAPVSNFFLNYSVKRGLMLDIADIQQINSHYARFRFGSVVRWVAVEPYQTVLQSGQYNVVFMIQVLEHLPDPLSVIQAVTKSLVSDGRLIFDFILSNGDGLDTVESLQQRVDVIRFIKKNYTVEEGQLSDDQSMGITVCRLTP